MVWRELSYGAETNTATSVSVVTSTWQTGRNIAEVVYQLLSPSIHGKLIRE